MTILWGILCLGIIVFIHEAGHFIAARYCGVTVESFSIGMGPVIWHKKIGMTDYRLSLLPLGGYCGMKGEKAFQQAIDEKLSYIPAEADSFYGVHPLKRICIAFAGPFANLFFAFLSFTIIAMVGYTYYSADNRVIMADEIYPDISSPAHIAGMQTGDRILKIGSEDIQTFSDITQTIATHPNETLPITFSRNGEIQTVSVPIEMDHETGSGKLGVVSWIEPVVDSIKAGSAAEQAGLQKGDLITTINGIKIENTADIQKAAAEQLSFPIIVNRNGQIVELFYTGTESQTAIIDGLYFSLPQVESPTYSFFPALFHGICDTAEMLVLTVKGIMLLFQGVDVSKAVSGPVRITVMLGDTVKSSFSAGFSEGLSSILNFLALISISLFIMNLLPIPILDGGLILVAFLQILLRRQIHPKIVYYIQFAGAAVILIIFVFALFNDIQYLIHR